MRVAPKHGREPAVEVPPHRELLARRLGVPVEDPDPGRALAKLGEERIDRAEGIVLLGHEDSPEGVHDERPVADDPARARIARRQVQRANAEVERIDLLEEGPLVPDVVPVGDHVGARVADLTSDLTGEPRAAGGVLAVHDHEVDASFAPDGGEKRGDGLAAGLSDDIADEEDPHAEVSKGARSAD